MHGRTIKLYIMGADYKNLKSAELSNWVGKAYIGERKHVPVIQNIDELRGAGIYFLLTKDYETGSTTLYIGETDDVAQRIKEHQQKDWWDEFVAFISKDTNLTKAHVRYLEKNLYKLASSNITTINLMNGSNSPGSKLPDSDKADMATFEENMIFVLNNLNIIDFAKTTKEKEAPKEDKNNVFYLLLSQDRKDAKGNTLQAKMMITDNGYLLLKGSYVEPNVRTSFKKHNYYKLRTKLENSGCFIDSDVKDVLMTKEDIPFNSPSASAAVVKNRATNGRGNWKLKDGTTLDEFEAK